LGTKEEIAAELRKILKVDVKFEKLSADELRALLKAVRELAERAEEPEEPREEDKGPLGLGILPAIRDQIREIIPEIRAEVQKTVRDAVKNLRRQR